MWWYSAQAVSDLIALHGAALGGAAKVIAVDLLDNQLEAARAFGATHTIKAGRQEAVAADALLADEALSHGATQPTP
jgi:Zn-dependent alcohol dehydrogenase